MKWYIGQPIVAIKNHSQGVFKKGQEFVIKGLQTSLCKCGCVLIDIGSTAGFNGIAKCPDCKQVAEIGSNINWFAEVMFAPLDVDISELTELLINKEVNH
jgi:phage FluMu protein Com